MISQFHVLLQSPYVSENAPKILIILPAWELEEEEEDTQREINVQFVVMNAGLEPKLLTLDGVVSCCLDEKIYCVQRHEER